MDLHAYSQLKAPGLRDMQRLDVLRSMSQLAQAEQSEENKISPNGLLFEQRSKENAGGFGHHPTS